MTPLLLLVDDEIDLLRPLEFSLKREGFATRLARTGAEALNAARLAPMPDLILLDLMLPDMSGTEVCRRLKADSQTARIPVVMLTARGEEIDRVVGFELGAEDYVVKPFSPRELLLRLRAILRRVQPSEEEQASVRFGRLRLDTAAHRAWVDQEEVVLTALEYRLLTTLHQRRGRVQTRERLLEDVWGMSSAVTTRTVDTHVKRLRQKIGDAGVYIETIRGVGYRFADQPDDVPVP